MSAENATGVFGKLPAHGDFIHRDLPAGFVEVWDLWLQGFVSSSREQLGEAWLDVYLTSPIWRFAFSAGAVDENVWAGIVLPSVDRVGRYFPFSVATRLPVSVNPTEFICMRPNWYQSMEEAALRALDGELGIDELIEELNDSNPRYRHAYQRGEPLDNLSRLMIKLPHGGEHSPAAALPFILDTCLLNSLQSYSIWSTSGSEFIDACLFISKGLPALGGIPAMMDGRWREWNWPQPFTLTQT